MDILLIIGLLLFLVWLWARVFLRASDHSGYDEPRHGTVDGRTAPSPEKQELLQRLGDLQVRLKNVPRREMNGMIRQLMNEGMLGAPVSAGELGVNVRPVDAGGVGAEWVLAPEADPGRRLMYLHGGGFYAGSPLSARMITASLSRSSGAAVLALDYRLMPESRRMDAVSDCREGYRWMIANGPGGKAPANHAFVGGDSAGGNLALMVSAWTRDAGERKPDGVIAFAPSTDSTLEGPSFRNNIASDALLGPALGPFARLPVTLKVLIALAAGRINPRDPVVSPLFGDLADLPPTLLQVSDCEMLYDDACRYANKAVSHGSPAQIQVWPGMVHVFQMFGHIVPEANEALEKAAHFIKERAQRPPGSVGL